MIQKVSNQENMNWLGNGDSVERESVNKSAMSSFEAIVKKMASEQIAKGQTLEAVASKFDLAPSVLAAILEEPKAAPTTKIACACDNTEDTDNSNNDAALNAYTEMYGKKKATIDESPVMGRGGSVLSARAGNITDIGGPQKQLKMETSNSIWDADKVARQMTESDNGERIRAENEQIAQQREEQKMASRYNTIDGSSLADALKQTDQRKGNAVSSLGGTDAHQYSKKLPVGGIGVFDTKEFERIPDKTAGEKAIAEKKEASNKEKDRSWLDNTKPLNSKDLFNRMINSIIDSKE